MVRVGVIRFPRSNCEEETLRAARRVGAEAVEIASRHDLQGADVLILPGGFSYGDYLRCGAIARFSPCLVPSSARRQWRAVIGICNGFQILCEAACFPGPGAEPGPPLRLPAGRCPIERTRPWSPAPSAGGHHPDSGGPR